MLEQNQVCHFSLDTFSDSDSQLSHDTNKTLFPSHYKTSGKGRWWVFTRFPQYTVAGNNLVFHSKPSKNLIVSIKI